MSETATPEGMVERVGLALCRGAWKAQGAEDERPWADLSPLEKRTFSAHARTAIAAMREPTPTMDWAALGATEDGSVTSIHLSIWRSMIDAALKEHPHG